MSLFRVSLLSVALLLAACSSPTADPASSEVQAFKARARDKVAAMGEGVDFDQAFEQGVTVAQQESGGVEPDARTCELTREAMQRG